MRSASLSQQEGKGKLLAAHQVRNRLGSRNRLRATIDTQLLIQVSEVGFDGGWGNAQMGCDRFVLCETKGSNLVLYIF
jgi:hypothetical protein